MSAAAAQAGAGGTAVPAVRAREGTILRARKITKRFGGLIAVHDIVSGLVPEVATVWRDVKATYADEFEFLEFVEQYPEVTAATGSTHMGIGLAVSVTAAGEARR